MKSNVKSNLIIIAIFLALLSINFTNDSYTTVDTNKISDLRNKINIIHPEVSADLERIHIDNNWTATKAAGICTGSGTTSNPYIIENYEIDGVNYQSSIFIQNSNVYFIIRKCIIFTYNYAEITLSNVTNAQIIDNDCSSGWGYGINLVNCDNNYILDNIVNSNNMDGIHLEDSNNNDISGNTINSNKGMGIRLHYSSDNIVSRNIINYNSDYGGIWLSYSSNNQIYLNCLTNNTITNAFDGQGSNNQWDNGVKGNFWSDYTGSDENGDGIGDISYNIPGPSGSQDRFPLMKCSIQDSEGGIPLEMIILISSISGGAVIGVAALLLIIRRRKRIQ